MDNLIGCPEKQLERMLSDWREKPYRACQILTWVYHHGVRDFDLMSNLSKDLRSRLKEHFCFALPEIRNKTRSRDGSIKYLFELADGAMIESVWMPSANRDTLCISTQVGCRLACSFCLTGQLGLKRNLSSAEIVGQIIAVNEDLPAEQRPSNIVIMGMGEPLDNYDEVVKAVGLMVSPHAMKLSTRKITLSTSGLVDKIRRFAGENLHVNLAVSLNATEDATRTRIMPINKKHSLEELLRCLRSYPLKPTRRITFEYVLIEGINDSREDAVRLAELLRGIRCKINLIPFNGFHGVDYRPPAEATVLFFHEYLLSKNFSVFVRKNRGTDILGACGQLAALSFGAAPATH